MSKTPDMKQIAEQLRAFAQQPHIQNIRLPILQLKSSLQDAETTDLRRRLIEYGAWLRSERDQLGGSRNTKIEPSKAKRGRPKRPQYSEDEPLILAIKAEMIKTGQTMVLPVARQFADAAKGGGTRDSKARRLEKAFRKRFPKR